MANEKQVLYECKPWPMKNKHFVGVNRDPLEKSMTRESRGSFKTTIRI